MDQRANKGILITPSDYTEQAYDFAKGKNIELINGSILKSLINEEECIDTPSNDYDYEYRNDRYNYLKKKKIDYKDFLKELYKLVPQEKVDYFFSNKQGVDADLLIGISKALKDAGNKVYMISGARTKDLLFW